MDIVRSEINFLVEEILGYIEEKEIVHIKCGIHKVLPVKEDCCNEEIKFVLQAYSPDTEASEWDIKEAYSQTIKRNSNLLIITNGRIFSLYAIGNIDDEEIQELIFEYNLLNDDLKLLCNDLSCLCRKNCGRKIIIEVIE